MSGARDDGALVQLARQGDKAAFAALIERHGGLLLALCRRTLGDPELARDAAQEATLRALLSLDGLRRAERFGPWLAGIGLNVCRGWLRHRPRECWSWEALEGGRLFDEPRDPGSDPEARAELADLSERVRRAVADLPDGQRAAVLLFYLAGLTHAETAAELGIEVGAVKARLHKGRATLRRRLLALWKEEAMPKARPVEKVADEAVEMRVIDVRRTPPDGDRPARYVVALGEIGGSRSLLIWVGQFEGAALAVLLEKAETSRPLTYQFTAGILEAAAGRLSEVRISRLADQTFYATVSVESPSGTRAVDARPSDALSLALVTDAPIRVEPAVLSAVEQAPPPADIRPTEWRLGSLREGSIGAAEIVAEVREGWLREGWKRKEEVSPAGADAP